MNEGFMCNDCTHFTIVEYGEGGMYAACTKNGGLVMINGQSPERCDDFEKVDRADSGIPLYEDDDPYVNIWEGPE